MSESAKIVLDVDDSDAGKLDQANAKIDALGVSAARASKSVQQVGDRRAALEGLERGGKNAGKAIADLGGALNLGGANDVGGGIGDIAEQLERAAGAAGSAKMNLAGTVTVMAAVGASAFAIGKAIGDVVWQTEYWNKQLEIAGQNSDRLTQKNLARIGREFSQFLQLESLEESPQTSARLKTIQTEIDGVRMNLRAAERERDRIAAAWWPGAGEKENADRAVRDAQAMLDLLGQQATALEDLTGFQQTLKAAQDAAAAGQREEAAIEAARERLELATATKDEQLAITAARQAATIAGAAELELLLGAADAADKRAAAEKAIARERQQLALMRTELSGGKDAAALARREADLVAEGVDRDTARKLAREQMQLQKRIDEKNDAAKQTGRDVPSLSATESRLLTSGRAADPNKSLLDELRKLRAAQDEQHKVIAKTADAWYELAKRPLIYGAPGQ